MSEYQKEEFNKLIEKSDKLLGELKEVSIIIHNDFSQLLEDDDKELNEPFTDCLFKAIQLIKK